MNKLLLIDGNSMLFRAYFATAYGTMMKTSNGVPTNAVFGFSTMLTKAIETINPTHIAVAWDSDKENFRHTIYPEYKAGRQTTPEELVAQFGIVREFLDAYSIFRYEQSGIEADDIIGTISNKLTDFEISILSSDKDLLQLIDDNVTVWLMKKGISELEKVDRLKLYEDYTLTPNQIIDLKGLMGDKSDNIPGIPSVGEKTAIKLLTEYQTVENVIESVDSISGKLHDKIIEFKDQAIMSKELATIITDADITIDLDEIVYKPDYQKLAAFYDKYEMKSLKNKLPQDSFELIEENNTQTSLEIVDRVPKDFLKEEIAICIYQNTLNLLDSEEGCALSNGEKSFYISLDNLRNDNNLLEYLKSDYLKVGYDIKSMLYLIDEMKLEINNLNFDTMISSFLVNQEVHTFDKMLEVNDLSFSLLDGIDGVMNKSYAIYKVYENSKKELEQLNMTELFNDIEMPLVKILYEMEKTGVLIDMNILSGIADQTLAKVNEYSTEIMSYVKEPFNINSPKQLAIVLFDELGLPANKKRSTSIEVLEKLKGKHPIIDSLMQYRKYQKLYSTYAEGLKKYVHVDGRIHTNYTQTVTLTGRLSSTNPNLQNISVKDEEGRLIRKAFIPSEGCVFLGCDYSQIELRVLAHIADESELIEAFNNHMDIHTKTAMDLFSVDEEHVTSLMRRQAKAVNFGIIYGLSDFGLAQQIDTTREEAKEFIDKYFSSYPNIRKYIDETIEFCETNGYVTTLLNRRRVISEIYNKNYMIREFGKRAATNARIQGTAADLIKIAMIKVDQRMKGEGVKSKMILQVHDELIFDVYESEVETMKNIIEEEMENALKLKVPLVAKCNVGSSWYEVK